MENEIIVSYADTIEVIQRSSSQIQIKLTAQGPQGPQGQMGELTKEDKAYLKATSDLVVYSKEETARIAAEAKVSQTASATHEVNSKKAATDAIAAETLAQKHKEAAQTALTGVKASEAEVKMSETTVKASEVEVKKSEANAKSYETTALSAATSAALTKEAVDETYEATLEAKNTVLLSEVATKNYRDASAQWAVDAQNSAIGIAEALAVAAGHSAQTTKDSAETKQYRADALSAKTEAVAANASAQIIKAAVEKARDDTQTAKIGGEKAQALSEAAADKAQQHDLSSEKFAQNSAAFASRAEELANAAKTFDPALYPTKANNGSDFVDKDLFLTNVGAQKKLLVPSKIEAEAGIGTEERVWTPQRIRDAILAIGAANKHEHALSDVTGLPAALDQKASLQSPDLTGAPTAPTPLLDDKSTRLATTEFVKRAIDSLVGGAPGALDTLQELANSLGDDPNFATTVTNQIAEKANRVHTHTIAEVELLAETLAEILSLVDKKAPLNSALLTGTPQAPTPLTSDNSARIATTKFIHDVLVEQLALYAKAKHTHTVEDVTGLPEAINSMAPKVHEHAVKDIVDLPDLLNAKSPLESPTFTGAPKAPTPAVGNDTTAIATTAFVKTALDNAAGSFAGTEHTHSLEGITGLPEALAKKSNTGHGHVAADISDLQSLLDEKSDTGHKHLMADVTDLPEAMGLKASLESPKFTGTPLAPTPAPSSNTTQLATTAFVTRALATFSTNLSISGVSGLQGAIDAKLDTVTAASTYETIVSGWTYSAVDMTASTARFPWVDLAGGKFRASWNDIKNNLQVSYDERYASATHTHTIANIGSLQEALDNKFSIEGGTVRGNVRFLRDGNTSPNQWIGGGNGDGATSTTNNLKLVSWYGIGLSPSIEGQAVPAGEYSHWFNTRNGDMGMRGSLTAAGNISAYSDERLKSDIETITDAMEMVTQMRGVRFTMNGTTNIGVIAQEIKKVAPEVVHEGDDEEKTLSVSYGNIVGVLIEAIKELKAEVNEMKRGRA